MACSDNSPRPVPSAGAPSQLGCTDLAWGDSAHFELDLRGAMGPTPVNLIVDADFAFEASLTHGPCGDLSFVHCAEPIYVDAHSRQIVAELDPRLYHLVVTGTGETSRGNVHVASSVGALACNDDIAQDDCAGALGLDLALGQQTVFVNTTCAGPTAANRCVSTGSPDVFYALDLSSYSAELMLDIELTEWGVGSLFHGSNACDMPVACGERFSVRVAPGNYTLGVADSLPSVGSREPFGLRIGISQVDCASATNEGWETAIDLDPSLATQRIVGNTACARNDVAFACNDDRGAPDLFYRLDLRGHTAPLRVQLDGTAASSLMYILATGQDAGATGVAECLAFGERPIVEGYFILAPRLYYLVLDGKAQSAGRFDLELRLTAAYAVPLQCFPSEEERATAGCRKDSESACIISLAHPACLQAALDCGLSADIYANFCAESPGCCDGVLAPDVCSEAWRVASTCPD
jgi:hypothetical protein